MRRIVLAAAIAASGCTCGRKTAPPPPAIAASESAAPPARWDLVLERTALVSFGNATPLPVSADFDEEVPALGPPLERATQGHDPALPLRLRVARDVPYGQLVRVMRAALPRRVTLWTLGTEDLGGRLRSVTVAAPGPLVGGRCFARMWVGPDRTIHVGYDPGADAAMSGVVVRPHEGRAAIENALGVVRRLDANCKDGGQLRVYTQPTATFGPLFDVALAVADAPTPPKVSTLMLSVPSIGPLDLPGEVVP